MAKKIKVPSSEELQKYLTEIADVKITLLKEHFDELHIGSGINETTINKYWKKGLINTINPYQAARILGYPASSAALLYTYPALKDDSISPYFAIKPLSPQIDKKTGKENKYIKPKGIEGRIFRPLDITPEYLFSNKPIIITEGEKKAIKASSEGFPTISIGGVNNWKTKLNETSDIITDLLEIPFENRPVYLIFDSDVMVKTQVKQALKKLALYLTKTYKDVNVLVPFLPYTEGVKCGIDDFFVNGGIKEDFQQLLNNAKPFYEALEYKGLIVFPNIYHSEEIENLWDGEFKSVEEACNARIKCFMDGIRR